VGHILVVDDEAFIREVLAEVLIDEGYAVQTAADGQHALEALAADVPDLIVSDIMMPRVTGWQLVVAVRESYPALPIILISAAAPHIARQEAALPDHTAFLAKPFALDDLLGLITRLIAPGAA
jgi:CheY-like chemotaxis protein